MLDQLNWFVGVVEDVGDENANGKVRVRIFGVHSQDPIILPTDKLPWATPLMGVNNASTAGYGWSATGVIVGAHVMGFSTDPAFQDNFLAFSWPGDSTVNGADTNPLTNGQLVTAIARQAFNAVQDVTVKHEEGGEEPEPPEPEDGYDPEKWMTIAQKEIGVKEYSGKFNNNPRIIEYHKTTSLGASTDEVSWCASFAGWVLIQAGFQSTKSAMARSYLNWGYPLSEPRHGAIVVFRRGNNPSSGHVGFVDKFDAQYIYCLGGNQSNQVKISRFKRSTVLGYRWPSPKTTATAKPKEENGKWSEPIPDRTPKEMPAPPPSGEVADQFTSRSVPVPQSGGTMYPYNSVFTSRSGHIMEIDDTPNGERIHTMHVSGSYNQFMPNGDVVDKSVSDRYDIVQFDRKAYTGGNKNHTVSGTTVLRNGQQYYQVTQSDYANVAQGSTLHKSTGVVEIQTADLVRLIGQAVEIANKLVVPRIEVDTIVCNNLTVANTINGNAKYADSAGRAPTKGGATPATPGSITIDEITPSLEDNGGNFGGETGGSKTASNAARSADVNTGKTTPAAQNNAVKGFSAPSVTELPAASQHQDSIFVLRQPGQSPKLMISNGEEWEKMS